MPPHPKTTFHIGCCGWAQSRAEYFRNFSVTEVQQTFYQPPRLDTLKKWRAGAPGDFEFTLKAWQLITHEPSSPTYRRLRLPLSERQKARCGAFRPTEEVYAAWQATRDCARALRARIVLFQCPASFTPTDEHVDNMRHFFARARRTARGLSFAWEVRGDWPDSLIEAICRELKLLHAVDPFVRQPVTSGTQYFRLHGIGGYRHEFSDDELDRLAARCRGESYVLFNNLTMARDALRFRNRVARKNQTPSARRDRAIDGRL
ncbi:MAG TPA: DUF72 domain-containing protein [Candidatus Acidoferrales bacterium]|nr:DUF72 domain-containing protein [Candidatus Acidoferrales bacterium]